MRGTWRKVIKWEQYKASTGYSLLLTLECGHKVGRKASQGYPNKVLCWECGNSAAINPKEISTEPQFPLGTRAMVNGREYYYVHMVPAPGKKPVNDG